MVRVFLGLFAGGRVPHVDGATSVPDPGVPDPEYLTPLLGKERGGKPPGRQGKAGGKAGAGLPFRFLRFFELPTWADTRNCSVERPCFLSDHSRLPCTEDRGRTGSRVSSSGM